MRRWKNRTPSPIGEVQGLLTCWGEIANGKYGARRLVFRCGCGSLVVRPMTQWSAGRLYSCGCKYVGFCAGVRALPAEDVRVRVAKAASSHVVQGKEHHNGKSYTVYRPDGLPPIRGIKNLSLWVRENQQILQYTCTAPACHSGLLYKNGWHGWRAALEK